MFKQKRNRRSNTVHTHTHTKSLICGGEGLKLVYIAPSSSGFWRIWERSQAPFLRQGIPQMWFCCWEGNLLELPNLRSAKGGTWRKPAFENLTDCADSRCGRGSRQFPWPYAVQSFKSQNQPLELGAGGASVKQERMWFYCISEYRDCSCRVLYKLTTDNNIFSFYKEL